MPSNYFEVYQRRRQELLVLVKEQQSIVESLAMDDVQSHGPKPGEILQGLTGRLGSESLKVLVIGRFSAGKSTFLNALFGKAILPASPTPTTGVVCEVKYADEKGKRAILYPKPGLGDSFALDNLASLHEELGKYVKIDHSGDATATSRYKKLELYWPLPLCRNGVELIDSVGLDDPDAREAVTMEYAQSADAILYCMKSQDTYAAKDKQVLGLLKSLGYESIFFIVTYYDHIKSSAQMGEITEDEFRRMQAKNLAPWSELKERGIKYVDSKSALIGRIQGNAELVSRSGIEEIESALELFLTQEKGKAKLLTSLRSLRSVNRAVRTVIPPRIGMWQTPNADLERRYREAEPRLKTLEQTRRLMIDAAERAIKDIAWQARDRAEEYFLALRDKIAGWAEPYEIEKGFGFPPQMKPVVSEVLDHLKERIEQETAEWNQAVLQPLLQEKIQLLEQSLAGHARDFFEKAHQIRIDLSIGGKLSAEELAAAQEPSRAGRVLAGLYTVMTGDFLTGGAGIFLGFKAMMTTILIQIVAVVAVMIFVSLNPIAIVLAALTGTGAAQFLHVFQLKKKIKTTVAEKLAETIDANRRELSDGVRNEVEKQLLELRDTLDASLAGELSSVRGEVEAVLEERKQGTADAATKITALKAFEQANLTIEDKIDALMCEAGIQG